MDPDSITFALRKLGEQARRKVSESLKGESSDDSGSGPSTWPPLRSDGMQHMEPDWEELDKKANAIIVTYTAVSAVANILPFGLDIAAVTGTFSKMATELAGNYQVIVSAKRARQMGMAIATTTATVLGGAYGAAYAGSRLAKLIPGAGYLVSVAIQAPLTAAVAWAAGDTLKNYFKDCRRGKEPSVQALSESFAKTLRLRLRDVRPPMASSGTSAGGPAPAPSEPAREPVADAVEKLAGLHELLRIGAISQEEYDAKKRELLGQI
jgi:uncharacterized protein (DUF697 family)